MKRFFRIIFKIFLIITILTGCATTGEKNETDPVALSNQGSALLEAGKFEDAVITQEKVIESLKKEGMPQNLMTPYIERLNAYKAQQPWREM